MEQQPKEPPLDEDVRRIRKDAVEVAKKLGISREEAIVLLTQRELIIVNQRLLHLHEMFDLLYGEKVEKEAKKAKGRKR